MIILREEDVYYSDKIYDDSDEISVNSDFGFDSNGDPIDESTVDELYRVANSEVLPTTELSDLGDVGIDEDSFEYFATGTAFGAYLKYTIMATIDGSKFGLNENYAFDDNKGRPDFNFASNSCEIVFEIKVEGERITTSIADVTIYSNGIFSSRYSDNFEEYWDAEKLCDAVTNIAEPAVSEIANVLSNI